MWKAKGLKYFVLHLLTEYFQGQSTGEIEIQQNFGIGTKNDNSMIFFLIYFERQEMASLIFSGNEGTSAAPTPNLPTSRPTLTRQLTGTSDAPEDEVMGNTDEAAMAESIPFDKKGENSSTCTSQTGQYQSKVTQPLGLKFNMGGVKDEGVKGKENQDDYFLWDKGDGKTFVIAVLDGHGRELGKLASKAAKDSIYKDLTSDAVLNQLRTTPKETMTEVFRRANDAIRTVSCWYSFSSSSFQIFNFL